MWTFSGKTSRPMSFAEDLKNRILILDGAMGTMIQRHFIGDNETLNLDNPDLIRSIHREFIEAGADIIETNSFGANRISQQEYSKAAEAAEMAYAAARIAREAADAAPRRVYVAGSVGPTGQSLTLPSDASDLTFRKYSFDDMVEVYTEQISALERGGVDFIQLETCFDALTTKAAIFAMEQMGCGLPVIISATVSDRSGRTLTGQTLEAFYTSVKHCPNLVAFGINCALGAAQMKDLAAEIAAFSSHPLIFYPNAGIPDETGNYNDTPENMASVMLELAKAGLLNIAGGCCGTTPAHIAAVAAALQGCAPRTLPPQRSFPAVSGLEAVKIDRSRNFTNIGERTNVAGSRKFARLISESKYQEALQVASDQVDGGAVIIDINMDDAMLDSKAQMQTFLRFIASEPSVGRAAIMIDSSHFDTIEIGLKNVQGRSIVNSISLKDGQEEFLRRARFINQMGASMVVMAFDEQGQAETFDRKIEICKRSYDLLTAAGIPPQDIVFDPNILSIGTGIESHSRFGVDYIEAVRWIKNNLPGALTSGGVSNLSFAFRGKNAVREAMHSAFLYHAIEAGLDMAIVNPQMLQVYDQIDPALLKAVEDLIFDRDKEATERLIDYAQSMEQAPDAAAQATQVQDSLTLEERITKALVKGGSPNLEKDLLEALQGVGDPVKLIEGPLMKGMEQVGDLFASGKMFLPQVVRSAKVMQDAVSILQPYMKQTGDDSNRPVIVIATVKGDVHDIGKNITSIVLQCSGFKVIDLGVMVPAEDILAKAREVSAAIIAVSGLITPSLFRMEELCRKMAEEGFTQPLFVGGAAASAVHTAVKLAPLYENVHYGADASASAVMAKKYMADPQGFIQRDNEEHERLRALRSSAQGASDASIGSGAGCYPTQIPEDIPLQELSAEEYLPDFDWKTFNAVCRVPQNDADQFKVQALEYLANAGLKVRLCVRYLKCFKDGDDIVCTDGAVKLPMLRQGSAPRLCLSDFFPEKGTPSWIGVFCISVSGDDTQGLLEHAARVTLAETASLRLQEGVRASLEPGLKFIAPGIGYACCPDHSLKRDLLALLPPMGVTLTDSCSMVPEASVCGFLIAHKDAAYHSVRDVTARARETYIQKREFTSDQVNLFLSHLEVVE